MVLERTKGVNERIYRFNSKCEKKRNMRNGIYELFCCCSNLSNDVRLT